MATLESAPIAGSRAGRYLFMRQQTSSYVGSLWEVRCEAEQQLLALARVVKVPSSIDADTEQNLSQAAWDSMELDDENIVRTADVVFGTGWFALVHDHYEGDTVRTMQRRVAERKSAVPVTVAVRIVLDTLEALRKVNESVEELGVSWNSPAIDPGSLLVCEDGRTRLLDGFVGGYVPNVPKMARDDETLAYAAPEMFENDAAIDERTQVFRVAVIAWELLSSKRLLVGSKAVMQRRLQSPIVRADRVTRVGGKASERLALVIEKALSVAPSERFTSLAEFEKALRDTGDKIGTQEEVIQFTDALAGRESTLARLVMDKPKRLSDTIKSVRPTAEVTKNFAAHVMKGNTAPQKPASAASGQAAASKATGNKSAATVVARATGKFPALGTAPDALFSAPARAARTEKNQTAARIEKNERALPHAPVLAQPKAPAIVATPAPLPATTLVRAPRLEPPDPARRPAPAPVPGPITFAAQVAAGVPNNATPPPRQRFKTLVGLFPDDLGAAGSTAQASAAELFEDSLPAVGSAVMEAATPASHVALASEDDDLEANDDDDIPDDVYDDEDDIRDGAESDEVEVGDDDLDGLYDAPTQAYNVTQFAEVAREARAQLESGPRLASKPPAASEDVFSAPAESPWQARGRDESRQAPAATGASVATESNLADLFDQEYTMPAAQAVPSSGQAPVVALGQAPIVAAIQAQIPVQAPAQPLAPPAKPDRRLLMLTMFFAGTTVALAIVALGLIVRSQSAEQAASALADAPVATAPSNVNAAVAPAPAPAPSPAPAAAVVAPPEPPVTAESPATNEANEPSEKDPAPAPATEAATAEGMDANVAAASAAAPSAPSPTPRAVRRAAPRKPRTTSQRYVPSDI